MTTYEISSLILELYVCAMLTWDIKHDRNLERYIKSLKQRTRKRMEFDSLTTGEHK